MGKREALRRVRKNLARSQCKEKTARQEHCRAVRRQASYCYSYLLKIATAFCPPKPKAFTIPALTGISRASFGT